MTYVKLAEAPQWVLQYPTCSSCWVELETDGDGWLCRLCGTAWGMNANDGDKGELYESWSGEELSGDVVTEEEARQIGYQREREEREKLLASLLEKDEKDKASDTTT